MKKFVPVVLALLALSSCSTSQTVYQNETFENQWAVFTFDNTASSPEMAILNLTVTTKNEAIQRLDSIFAYDSKDVSYVPSLIEYNDVSVPIDITPYGMHDYWLNLPISDATFTLHVQYDMSTIFRGKDDFRVRFNFGGTQADVPLKVSLSFTL